MSAKKYFCILDTETVSRARKVFDVGYKIIDRSGRVYEENSYVVAEQLETVHGIAEMMNDPFTQSKCMDYFANIIGGTGKYEVSPFDTIRDIVNDAINEYNATLCAYNIAFDINALNKTSQLYCGCDFFEEMPETLDIWAAAMSTLCCVKKYIKFIADNSIVTDKGNPQTGAEAMYKFITGNLEFEEAHTALEDCDIEAKILVSCINTHRKMARGTVGMCLHNPYWQDIVQRYYEYMEN